MKLNKEMIAKEKCENFDLEDFKKYVNTYRTEGYSDKTILLDLLYGIGINFDPIEFNGADGFKRFLEWMKTKIK